MNQIDAQSAYFKWRSSFALKVTLFHIGLILVFDLLGIFAPGIMTSSIGGASVFTVGLVFAFGIITSVICSTFYYSHRISQEERRVFDEDE
ncbi:MAG: uncharacterized membrane protein (DUF485 family) [Gammaproteobacteria bacterium]|jgi:uncharacterized membrane protein (DUF485 family)